MAKDNNKKSGLTEEMLNNPNVPEHVKKGLVAMDTELNSEAQPEASKPVDAIPPVVETPDTLKVEPGKEEVPPVAPVTPENVEDPDDPNADWKQKYLSLKGKYESEVPHLQKNSNAQTDVIEFYKLENARLKGELDKSSSSDAALPNVDVSKTIAQELADNGYDDPEDLDLFNKLVQKAVQPINKELSSLKDGIVDVVDSRAFDEVLTSKGLATYGILKAQSTFDYALIEYKMHGLTVKSILDSAIKNKDANGAAEILEDLQMAMIEDGLWQGQMPLAMGPAPVQAQANIPLAPKPVLPHGVTTLPDVPQSAVDPAQIEVLSKQFREGVITYEKFKELSSQILRQQAAKT